MGAEPGEIERKQIAALARCKRMQLIEEHIFEGAEQLGGTAMRQHESDLLGRGEEDVGRQQPLARAASRAGCLRCASPTLWASPSQRWERRGCARCRWRAPSGARRRACGGRPSRLARRGSLREIDQARQEAGERFAAAGRRNEERVAPLLCRVEQSELMGMRPPATVREPRRERFGQGGTRSSAARTALTGKSSLLLALLTMHVLLDLIGRRHQFCCNSSRSLRSLQGGRSRLAPASRKTGAIDGTVLWRQSGARPGQARHSILDRRRRARGARLQSVRHHRQPTPPRPAHLRHGLRGHRAVGPLLLARRGDRVSGVARHALVEGRRAKRQRPRWPTRARPTARPRACSREYRALARAVGRSRPWRRSPRSGARSG